MEISNKKNLVLYIDNQPKLQIPILKNSTFKQIKDWLNQYLKENGFNIDDFNIRFYFNKNKYIDLSDPNINLAIKISKYWNQMDNGFLYLKTVKREPKKRNIKNELYDIRDNDPNLTDLVSFWKEHETACILKEVVQEKRELDVATYCGTGEQYFRYKLGVPKNNWNYYPEFYTPPAKNFKNMYNWNGLYFVNLNHAYESHYFVLYIDDNELTVANTYGGVPAIIVQTFNKDEWISNFIKAFQTDDVALYGKLFGVTPAINHVKLKSPDPGVEWKPYMDGLRYFKYL